MENRCFIEMELTFDNVKSAKEFYKEKSAIINKSNKKHNGANILGWGDSDKYLFDGKITIENNKCIIYGWIKWHYDELQFYSLCTTLDELQSANVFQYSPTDYIYGRYVYKAVYNVPYKQCFHEYFIPEQKAQNMNMDKNKLIEYCRKETMKKLKKFLK